MAERELTAGVLAAIAGNPVRPVIFYEGEFVNSGTGAVEFVRLFTGIGSFVWDGKTWLGGGALLAISPIQEKASLEALGFSVTLSGLRGDLVQRVLTTTKSKNRPGKIWLGFFDAAGALIADPYFARRGRFDVAPLRRDPASGTFTIEARYEDRLVDLERPREFRYTPESQRLRHATDKGFDQVAELQDAQDVWGDPPLPALPPLVVPVGPGR